MYERKDGRNPPIVYFFTVFLDILENVFSQMYFRDIGYSPPRHNPTGIFIGVT